MNVFNENPNSLFFKKHFTFNEIKWKISIIEAKLGLFSPLFHLTS